MLLPMNIADVIFIQPKRHNDARGWFRETYSFERLSEFGIPRFVQDNESLSVAPKTVRGLHFQRAPFAQAKLVRCVSGAIYDVAVDIRPDSPTFGLHVAARLDASDGCQMFIPEGFAHGFCTLLPDSIVEYKVSRPYAPESEGGIAWNDPALGIAWPVADGVATVSDRDRALPRLAYATL